MEIILRAFERRDFDPLIQWINSQSETLFFQWGGRMAFKSFPIDAVQLEEYVKSSQGENPVRKIFKAADASTNEMVGYIELNNINLKDNNATISRVIVKPSLISMGIGQAMVKKIVEIGFNEYKLHRINLGVFDFNKGAIACYEKVGFKHEGKLRDCMKVGDEYWSAVQMSILEEEWLSMH